MYTKKKHVNDIPAFSGGGLVVSKDFFVLVLLRHDHVKRTE